MKNAALLPLIILLFACNQGIKSDTDSGSAKETELGAMTEKEPVTEEEIILDIRGKFEEINQNAASYETRSKELTGESTEGGELKSYYQNEELKKAVASYYGEMGKSIEEYYFSDNRLFFVFTQQYSYDKPIYVEGSKVKKIDENRYYFHNDKLVRWLDPNKEKVASSSFGQKESDILQKVKELKEISATEPLHTQGGNDDYTDMKSLFRLSPLSIFDETTEGINASEKEELLHKGESATWKITEETQTKLTIQCKFPFSQVTLYFLRNKNNLDGILAAEVINEKVVTIQSWKYSKEAKTLQRTNILKEYSANDFVSQEDKLPDSYKPVLNYRFVDDQTIEVSLQTWIEKEFEDREIINRIFLKWNGANFEKKIERIKK